MPILGANGGRMRGSASTGSCAVGCAPTWRRLPRPRVASDHETVQDKADDAIGRGGERPTIAEQLNPEEEVARKEELDHEKEIVHEEYTLITEMTITMNMAIGVSMMDGTVTTMTMTRMPTPIAISTKTVHSMTGTSTTMIHTMNRPSGGLHGCARHRISRHRASMAMRAGITGRTTSPMGALRCCGPRNPLPRKLAWCKSSMTMRC